MFSFESEHQQTFKTNLKSFRSKSTLHSLSFRSHLLPPCILHLLLSCNLPHRFAHNRSLHPCDHTLQAPDPALHPHQWTPL
ncbi:hypothetical protein Hanom_Chr08g00718711 [Helianthus anomalus]